MTPTQPLLKTTKPKPTNKPEAGETAQETARQQGSACYSMSLFLGPKLFATIEMVQRSTTYRSTVP